MADYSDIGLDQNMQPLNAPITQDRGFVSNTTFDANYETLFVNKLSSGVFRGQINVGLGTVGGYLRLDGQNNRIVVNDGTNNRIVIGSVA